MKSVRKCLHIGFAALALALSCTKEQEGMEPVPRGDYDPVVRFGLETYVGADEPVTKTTYAGDDKTILLNSVRYERIDWDVTTPDVVQILSEQDFTKYGDKNVADYKAKEIVGVTNNSSTKEDEADTAPVSGEDKDNLYWSAVNADRYFYAVYPSPNTTCVPNSKAKNFAIGASHTATVEGEIPGNQPYKGIKTTGTPGLSGSPASIEYLPDMTNAYMYAAAKVDKADAGYKKVPLRFKPLFSAVKLIVTARDAGAKNYRLKKVELRTDLHFDDVYLRPNNPNGTALGGKFKATFGLNGSSTGDFTVDPLNDVTDPLQRLTIDIPEADRYLLNEDTLKVTFLALPVEQQYLVVDYTFEYQDAGGAWKDVRRILALQDRKKIFKTSDKDKGSWYKLEKAHKLHVRSGVPEIEYHFKVQSQSFLPRVWRSDCPKAKDDILSGVSTGVVPNAFLAQDFYSVVSYRDSSGVLQPLKWQVTGYSDDVTGPFTATKPDWLFLRGENGAYNPAADKAVFFDPNQTGHPEYGYANNGIDPSGDPWDKAWGYGSHMDDTQKKTTSAGFFCGYGDFENSHTGVFFNAGGTNNGTALKDWLVDENQIVTYNYCDPDGNYYYTEPRGSHVAGEAYAYDLSSHDIYGDLVVAKNGDLGTTANCYVVSAPGWYRFPAVYGNAIKSGADNEAAYKGDGGPNRLEYFLNHNDEPITQPWIPGINKGNNGRDGVSLVWEDATDMIYAGAFVDSNRAEDLKPFYWEDPATGLGYIYFFVNQIAWSNAVIAAKSGSTIVWSWHIWCVPDPRNTLVEKAIEPNEQFGGGTDYNSNNANAINAPEFYVRYSTVRANSPGNFQNGDDFVYKSRYGNTTVWQLYDLGQGDAETASSPYKHCYVEFTQYWRGKPIAKRVVCMAQSGVEDSSGLADVPFYQWGRKDPLPTSGESVYADLSQVTSTSTIGTTIQHPATLYYGSSSYAPSGTSRYDNLWSTAVDYTTSTFLKFDTDGTQQGTKKGGRKDSPVVKTIYDPCPPGYSMPNLFAFTAFNPLGLFQTKINMNKIAYNHTATYDDGYHDLSTKYDGSQTFRRDITADTYNAGEFVRFYFRGRRNGNPGSTVGSIDQKNTGHYWLAEPASNKSTDNTGTWSYGSVFMFQRQTGNSQSQVYPVAGGEDISGSTANSSPKWQRTHACSVRPMKEQ
ncbi:MAG: hypothetical protein IJ714_06865 [Bacteroidales bacterium]|nr:hypothetical protein [Bacteroidales bacterium]